MPLILSCYYINYEFQIALFKNYYLKTQIKTMCKSKKAILYICLICTLKNKSWSKIELLEAEVLPCG